MLEESLGGYLADLLAAMKPVGEDWAGLDASATHLL